MDFFNHNQSAFAAASGTQNSSHHHHSPAAEEAQLLLRARCAELELRLAKQAELISDLRSSGSTNAALAGAGGGGAAANRRGGSSLQDGNAGSVHNNNNNNNNAAIAAAAAGGIVSGGNEKSIRDQFTVQRENGMLIEKNKSLENKLQVANDSLQSLQSNLAREVQRARDEGERHAQQLRAQLVEAQEHATCLQEKIVGLLGKDAAMRNAGLDELTTDNIFITTDGVLHRLQTDRRLIGQAARAKYDVATEFRGRTLVLTGKRINVLQLKSEVMQMLNECYSNLATDPTQRVDALRSKDSATRAELDHLRRTIATLEQTVSSLHTALHTANEKAARATAEAEVAKRDALVEIEKANGQGRSWKLEKARLERDVKEMSIQLNDAGGIQSMSVDALKKEVALSLEVRDELDRTRSALENALAAKETAERLAFAASQQLQAKDGTMESLIQRATRSEAAAMRMHDLEADLDKANRRIHALMDDVQQLRSTTAEERGRVRERAMRTDGEVLSLQAQLEEVCEAKVRLEEQLRMTADAAQNWVNFVAVVGRNAVTAATTPQELVALTQSAGTRVTRLEDENRKLREELQRAFEDMKTVAVALRDTKTAREQTLAQCDRMEAEKLRLVEERKQLNDKLIQATMQGKTREGEQTMRIQQLQHEVAYQKSRVDALHGEYQKRIAASGPSGTVAAAVMGGGNATTTDSIVRSGSASDAGRNAAAASAPAAGVSSSSFTSGAPAALAATVDAAAHARTPSRGSQSGAGATENVQAKSSSSAAAVVPASATTINQSYRSESAEML